jgi:hypothetical protein
MSLDSTALLLVGSSSNAIGTPPKEVPKISPSMDPIGAVNSAFASQTAFSGEAFVSTSCSYTWTAIAEPVRAVWNQLPRVEGIAVYGGSVPCDAAQMRNSGFDRVQQIVVGSPLFVRQL